MDSQSQQQIRTLVDSLVEDYIRGNIDKIVTTVQTRISSENIFNQMWPHLLTEDVAKLAQADPDFLQKTEAIPHGIADVVQNLFIETLPCQIASLADKNKYARGSKLSNLVKIAVQSRLQFIRDVADRLFERKQKDRFADYPLVRDQVILKINDACVTELSELARMGDSANEDEAKRHLKILTALSIPDYHQANRVAILRRISTGITADLPYVLKYLQSGHFPSQPTIQASAQASVTCITSELEAKISEARPLKEALLSYLENGGIISQFLDVGGHVAEGLEEEFRNLPQYIPVQGQILLPRKDGLEINRKVRYSLPDGIVCAIGLTIVLESLLRQIQTSLGIQGGLNLRPKKLIERLKAEIPFSKKTTANLDITFGASQISLRDAVAHGVFIADDDKAVMEIVAALTETLNLLNFDLVKSGKSKSVLTSPPWHTGYNLDAAHEQTFSEQFARSNLFKQPGIIALRKHAFSVFKVLIPDKASLCRASCLFWSDLGQSTPGRLSNNVAAEFVGILGGLISLEELFRAVQEHHGQRVLWPLPQNSASTSIRSHLSMMDDQTNGLLDSVKLKSVFGSQADSIDFQKCVHAVKALRDNVLHGGWGGLSLPKEQYLHLIVKLLFTLTTTVTLDSTGGTK